MKKLIPALFSVFIAAQFISAQSHQFDPPWNTPPDNMLNFTIPGIDNVPDLFGDINDPQLVVFFAGNQFMVVDSLIAAFKQAYPQYQRIFVETLPPGILAKQIAVGSITIGNMHITLQPDIFTDGRSSIAQQATLFSDTATYAQNNLAIMVRKGNPKNIKGWQDLARTDVKISMPNPAWEGIGKRIEEAYVKAGGETLRTQIMVSKVKDSSTILTQIHHRQTPMRILYNQSDAGPVWSSEIVYQQMIGHPIDMVQVPAKENITAAYTAGVLKTAPYAEAAKRFLQFLVSPTAKTIYRKYGFEAK